MPTEISKLIFFIGLLSCAYLTGSPVVSLLAIFAVLALVQE
jgi:hypothetical protein